MGSGEIVNCAARPDVRGTDMRIVAAGEIRAIAFAAYQDLVTGLVDELQ